MSFSRQSCLVIAGEKSGEEHALSFIPQLIEKFPHLDFWGVAGDDLEKHGVETFYHLRDFSSWGYSEVIHKIPFYYKALNEIEKEVLRRECKVAILVDFQSFNMKLSKRLKAHGVNVLYYVAPQAWAWKEYRAYKLADYVHSLFTIIPFEREWFRSRGVARVYSVAHPVWIHYKSFLERSRETLDLKGFPGKDKINLILLPGSRNFEVREQLPIFIEALKMLRSERKLHISIVMSPNVSPELYRPFMSYIDHVYSDKQLKYGLLKADMALASSGTVTLTTALFEVPTIVSYRSSLLNQFIYETFITYTGPVSLANIIHQKRIFPEFIQDRASVHNVYNALKSWMDREEEFYRVKRELAKTSKLVSGEGEDNDGGALAIMAQAIEESYGKN